MTRPARFGLPVVFLASWTFVPAAVATPRPETALLASSARPSSVEHQLGQTLAWRIAASGYTEVDYAALASSLLDGLGQSTTQPSQDVTAGRQRSPYTIGATLHLRAVSIIPARPGIAGGAVYVGRLTGIDARFDGGTDRRSVELGAPFMVQVDDRDGVRAYRFPRAYPESLARTVKSLVTPLFVVLPEAATQTWVTDEGNTEGLYRVDHELVGDRDIQRTRRPVHTAGAIEVRHGQTVSTLRLDAVGRVSSLALAEDLTSTRDQRFVGRHVGSITAERTTASGDLPETFAAAEAALADGSFASARLYHVEPHFAPRVEGRDARAMVSEFTTAVGANAAQAHALLMNHARLYPAAAGQVLSLLASRPTDFDDPVVVVGFAAIAAAGHVEAQRALVDALASSEPRTRERALISIMDLELPETFVLDAVWQTRTALAAKGPVAALSTSLATNVFGALGDVRRGNAEVSERVLSTLTSLLQSGDRTQRIMALDALANVGDFERVAPLAGRFFASVDAYERVAAFTTFRRMEGDEAFTAFASRFATEKDPNVLHEAAIVARDMSESPARNAWALTELTRQGDTAVLVLLVRIVGDSVSTHPDNARALRDLLTTQADRRLRREIFAFVTPSPKGGAQ